MILLNEIAKLGDIKLLFKVDMSVGFNSRYETSFSVKKLINDANMLLKVKEVETSQLS